MRTIKLNLLTGDVDLTNGKMSFVEGVDAIRQKLLVGLRLFLGEWFLDTRAGLPYYERILGKKGRDEIAMIFKRYILSCDGVTAVSDLVFDFDNKKRAMSISFIAFAGPVKIPVNDAFVLP